LKASFTKETFFQLYCKQFLKTFFSSQFELLWKQFISKAVSQRFLLAYSCRRSVLWQYFQSGFVYSSTV